ncbi:MAG: hypothetical protein K8S27_00890 [Candidatus Omnitrophica bacterium]|nr:hypothetical protein [Candidatus Omnitrophota bacterium]
MEKKWKTYEEVARFLLDQFAKEFGFNNVEGKQIVNGFRSGTKYEIDAKGVPEGNQKFIIIECRRYISSKQNQEKLGSLAYRIIDSGASGGIIVSPLGLQEGAQKIAAVENIVNVTLDASSTPQDFCMKFLDKIFLGCSETIVCDDSLEIKRQRKCHSCGKVFVIKKDEKYCPDCNDKKS